MNTKKITLLLLSLFLIFIFVRNSIENLFSNSANNQKDLKKCITITRFDIELIKCKTIEEIIALAKNYPEIIDNVYTLEKDQSIEDIAKEILKWLQNPIVQELFSEVKTKFENCNDIEQELSLAFNNLQNIIPESTTPKIFFVVSGMKIEIIAKDDFIILGLDYFLGKNSKFRPPVPEHRLHLYERQNIAPACVIMSIPQYVKDNLSDASLIADMIFFGRVYALAEIIMPEIEKNIIFSYKKSQLATLEDNEVYIWDFFVRNNLLYKTDEIEKSKYIESRVSIDEIYPDCPGEVAKWLGFKIIKSYLRNNKNITISELIQMTDLQVIFQDSEYKPYI